MTQPAASRVSSMILVDQSSAPDSVMTGVSVAVSATMDDRVKSLLADPVVCLLRSVFEKADEELSLVGGSVRDLFSTGGYDDLDFATSARPDRTLDLVRQLGTTWEAGRNFGTIGVEVLGQKVEITTYRADTYDRESRKPEVAFSKNLLDDLSRRDFTMNAMAIDVSGGTLVDPFNGYGDLNNRLLRTPLDPDVTIRDDPLRSLRAIRFASTRDMSLHKSLFRAIRDNQSQLAIVSQERKTAELMKIAAHGVPALLSARDLAHLLWVTTHLFGGFRCYSSVPVPFGGLRCYSSVTVPLSPPIAFNALLYLVVDTPNIDEALAEMKFPTVQIRHAKRVQDALAAIRDGLSAFRSRCLVRLYPDAELGCAVWIAGERYHLDCGPVVRAWEDRDAIRGRLPINGDDLLARGYKGPTIGKALRAVEAGYLADLQMSKSAAFQIAEDATLDERAKEMMEMMTCWTTP